MRWSDRSPAARVMLIGGGGLLAVAVALLVLAAVNVIPIDALTWVLLPVLGVVSAGSIVGSTLDRRWQLDRSVVRARADDDGHVST